MVTYGGIRIAVCDDTREDCIHIAGMAKQLLQEEGIVHNISLYESGKALLGDIQKGEEFQILLLDVLMEQMDGLELAASLRKQQNKTAIIFISVNRELALYGYEVAAARYLAKPLDKERLKEALLYCYRNRQEDKEILLPTVMGQRRISVSDIQYIEAFERGTRVVLLEESEESRCKFSEMKEMLPEHLFLQCHRSYAVNLSCVKIIRRYDFILKSGLTVPISKNRFLEVYQLFADYIAD